MRGQVDIPGDGGNPLLLPMPGQRLLGYSQNTHALQCLDIARDRAAIAFQLARQIRDGARRGSHLLEQKHPLRGKDLQQRFNIVEGHHPAGRNPASAVRQLRQLASAFKERLDWFHPDFSLSHFSPPSPDCSILSENAPLSHRNWPNRRQSPCRAERPGLDHRPMFPGGACHHIRRPEGCPIYPSSSAGSLAPCRMASTETSLLTSSISYITR